MTDAFNVTADELRSIVERVEQLEYEKKDLAEQISEVFSEAKGRGFDTKAIKKIIAIRKKNEADRQEEEAILDVYLTALGMV